MKQLRDLLAAKGINTAELARRLKTTHSTVSRWVCGTRPVSKHMRERFARHLGITIKRLKEIEDESNSAGASQSSESN